MKKLLGSLIVICLLLSGCGFFQPQQTEVEETTDPELQQQIVNDELVTLEGKLQYDSNNDLFLFTEDGIFKMQIQEPTKLFNIPDERISARAKEIIEDTGTDHVWFGLISDIKTYLLDGEMLEVIGNFADSDKDGELEFIADEITLTN